MRSDIFFSLRVHVHAALQRHGNCSGNGAFASRRMQRESIDSSARLQKIDRHSLDGSHCLCEEKEVMFTLTQPSRPWGLERVVGYTCAVGGVDHSMCKSLRAGNPEIDMR